MQHKRKSWLELMVFIVPFLLYLNTLNHAYVLDDFSVIKDNYIVKKGIEGIPEIFKTHYRYGYGFVQANLYRPLSLGLFAIQWELAPDQPWFAHFCNVLLYGLCCLLLYRFLKLLFEEEHHIMAFLSSMLFVAHPIHTEVVANIKSADSLIALIFSLLTAIYYLKFFHQRKMKQLILANLYFFLALLSKESAVVFLGIIPLSVWMFREKKPSEIAQSFIWILLPFVTFLCMRRAVLGSLAGDKTIAKIDNLLMAAPNQAVELATAIKILGLYIWKLILPHPLMNDYSMNQITLSSFQDWRVWLAFLVYASLIYLFFRLRKSMKIIAFGIACFLLSISLFSNLFFTIGTSFGERLMFLPSIGFSIMLTALLFSLSKTNFKAPKLRFAKKAVIPLMIIFMLYAFKTIERNADWKDNFTLYSADVENCDRSARCHYYHGLGLMKEKAMQTPNEAKKQALLQQSILAFSRALEIFPSYSDAYGQRGLAHYRLKNYQAALVDYDRAIQFNPQSATAYSNRGTLLFEMGDYQKAKASFEQALKYNPNFVDALANYASTLGTLGDYGASINYFQRAIELRPNEASYYRMIGISYQNMGNQQQANFYFNKAGQIQAK